MPDPRPLAISAPFPRTLELIFTPEARDRLHARYEVLEADPERIGALDPAVLARARYIIGQPPLSRETLEAMPALRCVFNVESNLLDNMPYDLLFERGIHTVTTGAVFAEPVAEIGLGLALDLARGITDADLAFREGRELWGGDGNAHRAAAQRLRDRHRRLRRPRPRAQPPADRLPRPHPRLRPLAAALDPRRAWRRARRPRRRARRRATSSSSSPRSPPRTAASWAPTPSPACAPAPPSSCSAAPTWSTSPPSWPPSRAGHIRAASDVFPEEPLAPDHPVRALPGFLRSAHRAGALDVAFKRMGDMVLEDMDLIDRGLPPLRCKRAERETVSRMRSRPVSIN